MVCSVMLLGVLCFVSYTDVRWHRIPNNIVYPATVVAWAACGLTTWFGSQESAAVVDTRFWAEPFGFVSIHDSCLGALGCGGVLLVCYLFMAGEVGGGDVKLMAMIGAYLGIYAGWEVVLWTFIIAACFSVIRLIWQFGAWMLIVRCLRHILGRLRLGSAWQMPDSDQQALRSPLYLAPSALLAVAIVRFELLT